MRAIRPLHDYLVVQIEKEPGMIGLIHIPDSGLQKDKTFCLARVQAAGPKCELVKSGDLVHLPGYGSHSAGAEINLDGRKLVLIRERHINGVMVP